jgi:hypothetical protein
MSENPSFVEEVLREEIGRILIPSTNTKEKANIPSPYSVKTKTICVI